MESIDSSMSSSSTSSINLLYGLNESPNSLSSSSISQTHESNNIQSANNGHQIQDSTLTRHPAAKAEVKENSLMKFFYNVWKLVVKILTFGQVDLDSKSKRDEISPADQKILNIIQVLHGRDRGDLINALNNYLHGRELFYLDDLIHGTNNHSIREIDLNGELEEASNADLVLILFYSIATRKSGKIYGSRKEVFKAFIETGKNANNPLGKLQRTLSLMTDSEKTLAQSVSSLFGPLFDRFENDSMKDLFIQNFLMPDFCEMYEWYEGLEIEAFCTNRDNAIKGIKQLIERRDEVFPKEDVLNDSQRVIEETDEVFFLEN